MAPNHWDVTGLRLQGFEDGATNQWIGFSQFLPGGGAGPDSTAFEKVYVVLEGEMTIEWDGKTDVLRAMDSCTIPASRAPYRKSTTYVRCWLLYPIPGELSHSTISIRLRCLTSKARPR